ncbi:MAG: hypothetical protein KAS17_00230 [Victivallaceae bacterium]|nr:hypothetical protein [Victivallaceae bacterium]
MKKSLMHVKSLIFAWGLSRMAHKIINLSPKTVLILKSLGARPLALSVSAKDYVCHQCVLAI